MVPSWSRCELTAEPADLSHLGRRLVYIPFTDFTMTIRRQIVSYPLRSNGTNLPLCCFLLSLLSQSITSLPHEIYAS